VKTEFKASFLKCVHKIVDNNLKAKIIECIQQVELSDNIKQINDLKKLKSHKSFYRIKLGDYRIGVKIDSEIVVFVTVAHRKDIYKLFPK
jgi:mRNA interferase RelE/StbE